MTLKLVQGQPSAVERTIADLTARIEQSAREAFVAGFALGNQREHFISDAERDRVALAIWEGARS